MTKPTIRPVRPVKTQISLGICPVWSESSLCAQWVVKDPSFLHADSKDWSDWVDAQAELSLHWAHIPFYWFCRVAVQLPCFLLVACGPRLFLSICYLENRLRAWGSWQHFYCREREWYWWVAMCVDMMLSYPVDRLRASQRVSVRNGRILVGTRELAKLWNKCTACISHLQPNLVSKL